MNLYAIAMGALGAGLGALLASPLQKRWPRHALTVRVVAVVGAMTLATNVGGPMLTKLQDAQRLRTQASAVFANPQVVDAFVEETSQLSHSPAFVAWMERQVSERALAPERAQEEVALLTQRGAARLSDSDLSRMAELKAKLAANSPALCAGFFTGQVEGKDLFGALDKLASTDAHAWFGLSTRAAQLELAASPPARGIDAKDLEHALAALVTALGVERGGFLTQVLNESDARSESERCQAFQLLAKQTKTLPASTGLLLTRYIAAPQLLTSDAQVEGSPVVE